MAGSDGPLLSVIVPALDEAAGIDACLSALAPLRARGHEVIVVDGGSRDGTPERAAPLADAVLRSRPGRAVQLNAGARQARHPLLLFLHADTRLPADAAAAIAAACARGAHWGRFDVRLCGRHPLLPVVAAAMNRRSRWTGIATGDQAIFVSRPLFDAVGGFPEIPLMEDIALSARLRSRHWPACLRQRVDTAGRRWDRDGLWRTILLMWSLRLRFWLGADPAALARAYRHVR